ncbi:MAG: thioredoxin family protein [Bacteroidota bacterium]
MFKHIFPALTSLLIIGASYCQGIDFIKGDISTALQTAKDENKLIFVDVYTEWCGPCKWMDKNIYTNDTVAEFYNRNFICVKVKADEESVMWFTRKHKVTSYPTFFFFDHNKDLKHKSIGKREIKEFIQLGKDALNPGEYLSVLTERYEAGERDPQLLTKYIKILREAGLPYKDILSEFFENQKDWFSKESWEAINKYVHDYDSEYFRFLQENRKKFESLYGKKVVSEKIRNGWFKNLMKKCQNAIIITALALFAIGLISTFYWIFIAVKKALRFVRKKKMKSA